MIVVKVELHSARTRKITEIARMQIANIGGTRDLGVYIAKTLRGRSREQLAQGAVQREGLIRNYPRLKIHVWHLVALALIGMRYAGAAERAQTGDLFEAVQDVPGQRAP